VISQADLPPVLFVQWVIDTISHDKKDSVVKEKQLEALKRLGHTELKLNEYERTLCSVFLNFSHSLDIQVKLQMKSYTQMTFL